jgi:hypothetical protein
LDGWDSFVLAFTVHSLGKDFLDPAPLRKRHLQDVYDPLNISLAHCLARRQKQDSLA